MARHDVLNRRCGAAIGHEHHLRRRRLQKSDGAQMRRRADAGVGKLELIGFALARPMISLTVLAGSAFAPTNDNGVRALTTIGRKSLIGS